MKLIINKDCSDLQSFIRSKELEYNLKITLVQEEDAEFIIKLRNDFKARYLNVSVSELQEQINWINKYVIRQKNKIEFYFLFWYKEERIGTIRFIKTDESTFESGSWLFINDLPFNVSIKAELFCKDFGFDFYNLDNCCFYINKKNTQVLRYHNLFKPKKLKEDETHEYYILSKEDYHSNRNKIIFYCQ